MSNRGKRARHNRIFPRSLQYGNGVLQGATCISDGKSLALNFQENNITCNSHESQPIDNILTTVTCNLFVLSRFKYRLSERKRLGHIHPCVKLICAAHPYNTALILMKAYVRCCLWICADGLTFRPLIAGMANWIAALDYGLHKHTLGLVSSF